MRIAEREVQGVQRGEGMRRGEEAALGCVGEDGAEALGNVLDLAM